MPFSSRACQTCKIRRVKCDETKPTCLRCTKSGQICLATSVVEQPGFMINVENAYASGKVKRPRGPRSSLTSLRPHFDLEARAVAYYLQDHVLTSDDVPDVAKGLCTCFAAWKASGVKSVMVDLALSSISLAVFSRVKRHPEAGMEASSKYSVLLRMVKERIKDFNSLAYVPPIEIDACLLTTFLMGRYEATMPATCSTALLQKSFHHEGALAVLKIWTQSQNAPQPTPILRFGRRGLIRSSLLRSLPLPDWILDGERFGEDGLESVFDRVFVGAVCLHHASQQLPQQGDELSASVVLELLNQARELDDSLRDWAGSIPPAWAYRRHTLPEPGPWPKRYFYRPTVYSFQSVGYASVWSQYFAARMLINSTRLRLLTLGQQPSCLGVHYGQSEWLESSILLNCMADRLAFTIPFALGKIKILQGSGTESPIVISPDSDMKPCLASLVVWQLAFASGLEWIEPQQQRWFRSETAQLGRRIGNRILESAEMSRDG
ncbi:Fungal Zn2-Cys6 binuclear cluster domain-containing protein [Cladophialophora immunda]|nr:Fungal Zn2-Cys6 binuclear cluster domain-containing protein [Cladophialophora immunda]